MDSPEVHVEEHMLSQERQAADMSVLVTHPCLQYQVARATAFHIRGITLEKGNLCANPCFVLFCF